ncbi:MAG: hypothetical protein Q7S12_04720 [bacterium]|nr:hypothetical protein [bacterium]
MSSDSARVINSIIAKTESGEIQWHLDEYDELEMFASFGADKVVVNCTSVLCAPRQQDIVAKCTADGNSCDLPLNKEERELLFNILEKLDKERDTKIYSRFI